MTLPFSRKRRRPSSITLADRARDAGHWDVAAEHYRTALERNPARAAIWVQYGHVLKQSGRRDQAEAAYRRAITCEPTLADSHLQLGHVLKLQGKQGEAEAAYLRALALAPDLVDARVELRRLRWGDPNAADLNRARASISSARRRWWGTSSLIARADEARDVALWGKAARLYRKALHRSPRNPEIWAQLGRALKENGDLAEAEVAYRRALVLDAKVADTYRQLGHVLKLQGKTDEARSAYLQAFALEPSDSHSLDEMRTVGWSAAHVAELTAILNRGSPDAVLSEGKPVQDLKAAADGLPVALSEVSGDPDASDRGSESETERRILSSHGLAHDVLQIFDHLYYFYANPLVAADVSRPNRRRCLTHFCERGVDRLLAFNERFLFDPAFYIENYLGDAPVPPSLAYRHWLNVGRRLSWQSDRDGYIRSILDIDMATIAKIDLNKYLSFSKLPDPPLKFTDAFFQFIDHEVLHSSGYLPITEESADFFTAIGERFSDKGQDREALIIFARILVSVPKHRRSLLHMADVLARTGNILDVLRIHETVISENEALLWSHLHRANCYVQLGDYRKALSSLRSGILSHPGDVLLRRRFQEVADEFLPREWQQAVARGLAGNAEEAQRGLYEVCKTVSSLNVSSAPLPHRPIRSVAIVGLLSAPQCRLYRIDQKIEHLETTGFQVTLYDGEKEIPRFLSQIFSFEAVIFYRLPAWAPVVFAIQKAKELGIVTLYDIDDFIFGEKDYPDPLESFGGLITRKEWVQLKMGAPFYRHAISLCDFAIASTTPLADEMAKLVGSGRAFVHRNAFGRSHELHALVSPRARTDDKITIFYGSGTKSHKGDFQEFVEPGLVEMVRRYGERIVIVLVGYHVLSERLNAIRANLTLIEPVWDIAAYWSLLSSSDINIAVLKESPMTHCKSEIKWMEAAMFAVPSVVSGTATYREAVEPGITGLICDTTDEWTEALDLLITNSSLRRSIGLEAQRRVQDRYSIPIMAENLSKMFESIMTSLPAISVKPTVLIVNVFYPPQTLGGATRVVHDNVTRLSSVWGEDIDIEVFTTAVGSERDYDISCYVQDGVRVTAVSRPALPEIETRIIDDEMEQIFGSFLDSVRPSVVHFHCIQRLSASVVAAVRKRKIPYLITVHDGWWISDFQFITDDNDEPALYDYANPSLLEDHTAARMARLRPLLFGAHKVLAVSESFADLYRDCGVPNVLAVPNGVSYFPKVGRTGSGDGRVRLGFIGGPSRHKGYHLIKYALLGRNFEHLCLTVIDASLVSGESRSEVWNTTPVDFLPKYPESQVGELYAAIDVLLAPSVCVESFGLITREALQCGCWVIASDRGSIGECVTDGYDGYVIDVSDAEDLIRVLSQIEKNPRRYLTPPPEAVPFRKAAEQGDELANLYMSLSREW